ncbi:MAG: hypothetical protein HRU41_06455 [Saprospiraceae bacterium]|nr:hypothetical protein [Saprospiraceae bacterium]
MMELSFEYMNKLASQIQFISALLCGFSLTILVLLFDKKGADKISINIFRFSILATGTFLVSIFAMTDVFMMTTEGFPFKAESKDLLFPNTVGMSSFFIGITSIAIIIALVGWTQSKALGIFSTIVGLLALILIILMMT